MLENLVDPENDLGSVLSTLDSSFTSEKKNLQAEERDRIDSNHSTGNSSSLKNL